MSRLLLALAGLFGAAGVAAAAAGSHTAETNLSTAGTFLLLHAAALAGVSRHDRNPVALGAGLLMALGVVLFGGDLAMRARAGMPLFPMAAPLGGVAMILGWLGLALSALRAPRG